MAGAHRVTRRDGQPRDVGGFLAVVATGLSVQPGFAAGALEQHGVQRGIVHAKVRAVTTDQGHAVHECHVLRVDAARDEHRTSERRTDLHGVRDRAQRRSRIRTGTGVVAGLRHKHQAGRIVDHAVAIAVAAYDRCVLGRQRALATVGRDPVHIHEAGLGNAEPQLTWSPLAAHVATPCGPGRDTMAVPQLPQFSRPTNLDLQRS